MIDESTKQRILERIGATITARAKELCPFDEGTLIQSIQFRIEGDTVIIFSDLEYADDLEYGKPPEPLTEEEKESLTEWSERHDASPNAMISYIETNGIKVGTEENPIHITSFGRDSYRPFLRPAAFQSIEDIKRIIKEEI